MKAAAFAVALIAASSVAARSTATEGAVWVFNPQGSPEGPTFVFGQDESVTVSGACGSSVSILLPFTKEAMAETVRKDVYPHLRFNIDEQSRAFPVTAFRIVEFGGPLWQVEASGLPKALFEALSTARSASVDLIEPREKTRPRIIATFGQLGERGRKETMAAIAKGCFRS
jgi:hypothetical protein